MVLQVDEIWRKFKPCEVTIVSNMKSSPSWPNTFHKKLPPCENKKQKLHTTWIFYIQKLTYMQMKITKSGYWFLQISSTTVKLKNEFKTTLNFYQLRAV
jgi:hypothetical protein